MIKDFGNRFCDNFDFIYIEKRSNPEKDSFNVRKWMTKL